MKYGNKYKVNKWKFINKGLIKGIIEDNHFDFCILSSKEFYNNENGEKEGCFENLNFKLETETFNYDLNFTIELAKDQKGFFNKVVSELDIFCVDEVDNNADWRLDPINMFGFESLVWEKVWINDHEEDESTRKVYPKWNPYNLKIYFSDDPKKFNEWQEVKIIFDLYSFHIKVDIISEVFNKENDLLPKFINDSIKKDGYHKFSYIRYSIVDRRNNKLKVYTQDSVFDFNKRREYYKKLEYMEFLKENKNIY